MTETQPDAQLDAIRERARRMIADHVTYAPLQHAEDYSVLLAEVERLNAELASAHADALNRGAAVLDHLADTAEAKVLEHYNGACGRGSCDLVRESARTLRDMAATHAAPSA